MNVPALDHVFLAPKMNDPEGRQEGITIWAEKKLRQNIVLKSIK